MQTGEGEIEDMSCRPTRGWSRQRLCRVRLIRRAVGLTPKEINMNQMIPSLIIGFREGLEAFLLIAIVLKYISKTDQFYLKNKVIQGSIAGFIISLMLGMLLNAISVGLGGVESLTKLWESVASLVALALVSTFIFWMIRHGIFLLMDYSLFHLSWLHARERRLPYSLLQEDIPSRL